MQSELSKKIKQYAKSFDSKAKVDSITGSHNKQKVIWYIRVWFITNFDQRVKALKTIYGENFDCGSNAIAGNVSENYISMKPSEWEKFLK
jgi:hypothetical protein